MGFQKSLIFLFKKQAQLKSCRQFKNSKQICHTSNIPIWNTSRHTSSASLAFTARAIGLKIK